MMFKEGVTYGLQLTDRENEIVGVYKKSDSAATFDFITKWGLFSINAHHIVLFYEMPNVQFYTPSEALRYAAQRIESTGIPGAAHTLRQLAYEEEKRECAANDKNGVKRLDTI